MPRLRPFRPTQIPVVILIAFMVIVGFQNCSGFNGSYLSNSLQTSASDNPGENLADSSTFEVSPKGNDTIGRPFRTIAAALEAVRKARSLQALKSDSGPLTIYLRGGVHVLDSPLLIGPEHGGSTQAPLRILAFPGERPIITAAQKVSGWARVSDRVWRAPFPVQATNLTDLNHNLWVNGDWAPKARIPKNPNQFSHPEIQSQSYWFYASQVNSPDESGFAKVPLSSADLAKLKDVPAGDLEVSTHDQFGYIVWTSPVTSIGTSVNFVNPDNNVWIGKGTRFFLSNLPSRLMDPGEWQLLKSDRKIEVALAADATTEPTAWVSNLSRILNIAGSEATPVENVVIEGIEFTGTSAQFSTGNPVDLTDASLRLEGAKNIQIRHCFFRNLTASAIVVAQNTSKLSIEQNVFEALGGSAVSVYGHPYAGKAPTEISIATNFVSRTGLIRALPALLIYGGSKSRIENNEVHDSVGIGIAIYARPSKDPNNNIVSTENAVTGNEVVGSALGLSDIGGIYLAGNGENRQMVVMNSSITSNRVRDTMGASSTSDGQLLTPHGASGIYLDNEASGNLVKLNVVSHSSHASLKLNGGSANRFHQNLLSNSSDSMNDLNAQFEFYGWGIPVTDSRLMHDNEFYLNSVMSIGARSTTPIFFVGDNTPADHAFKQVDGNLYWRRTTPEFESQAAFFKQEGSAVPQSLVDWRTIGFDVNSAVARENPGVTLSADGLGVLGHTAGSYSATNWGPGADMATGLRRGFAASSATGKCLTPLIGSQYAPLSGASGSAIFSCFLSEE